MHKPRETPKHRREQVYLLRLWQVEMEGSLIWRASLEDAHTGERQGFADLALLSSFLNRHTVDNGQESTMEISDADQ